jgi:predicted metal-dependent hydrolase
MGADFLVVEKKQHTVLYGKTEITYYVNICDRKTLAIHVYPDGKVFVDAPITASDEAIAEKVKKKASWIFKQKMQFEAYPPVLPKRSYQSGESHRYLGKQYRLLVIQGLIDNVKLLHGRLIVETPMQNNPDKIRTLLQEWYRLRAKVIFSERYNLCIKEVAKLEINHNQGFRLRFMSNRWGSCTTQGKIFLNPELIAAPKDCIDYVITHELCHLKEHNHGKKFYKLLSTVMNDWEIRRKRLNEMVEVRFI